MSQEILSRLSPEQRGELWAKGPVALKRFIKAQVEISRLQSGEGASCEGLLAQFDLMRTLPRSKEKVDGLRETGGRLYELFGENSLDVYQAWREALLIRAERALNQNSRSLDQTDQTPGSTESSNA